MIETVLHSFEKDGIIYPPIEAECGNCFYQETKITGFNFGGEVLKCYCAFLKDFVEPDDEPCKGYGFDYNFYHQEQAEEYCRLESLGELDEQQGNLSHQQEVEDFLKL